MATFDDPARPGPRPDPAPVVDFLAALADGGPVLELAIGSGRVAVPLAARGLAVSEVEGSPAMVAKMRTRPGPFKLAYLVFHTLFHLVDADRQAECFRAVARVLAPGGAFVVEAFVPNLADFERDDQQTQVRSVTADSAASRLHRYDRPAQTLAGQTPAFTPDATGPQPFGMRYLWPEQIDRLAEQAGLRLEARYADWHRTPFDATSTDHVSVYRR